jgi:hypothetical protein
MERLATSPPFPDDEPVQAGLRSRTGPPCGTAASSTTNNNTRSAAKTRPRRRPLATAREAPPRRPTLWPRESQASRNWTSWTGIGPIQHGARAVSGNAAKTMNCDLHPRLGYRGAIFAATENTDVDSLAAGDTQGRFRPLPDEVVTGAAQRGKRRPAGSCAAEAFRGTRPLFAPRHPRAPHLR